LSFVKSVDSLARKIAEDVAEKEITAVQAGAGLFDVIRYATIFPESEYAASAQATIDSMRVDGYTVNVKNFWNMAKNPYQGINAQILSPDGQRFELHFHTRTSLDTKNGEVQAVYEKLRAETDPAKRADYAEQMFQISKKIPVPPGVAKVR